MVWNANCLHNKMQFLLPKENNPYNIYISQKFLDSNFFFLVTLVSSNNYNLNDITGTAETLFTIFVMKCLQYLEVNAQVDILILLSHLPLNVIR